MHFTDLRLKLIRFFRNKKYIIYLVVIVLTIIIAINIILGKIRDAEPPSTVYEPHEPVIYGDSINSKKMQNTIETMIDEYMKYCKEKDYESAYNLLSDECRKYKFGNNIKNFKTYIDSMFDGDKIYSIQDYSNKDDIYIYEVSIFEDIMATGMNTETSDEVDLEKVVITKNGNDYKLAVSGFIKAEDLDKVVEDENIKINIEKKVTYYDKVIYSIKVKNKTSNEIVFERNDGDTWLTVSLDGDIRRETVDHYESNEKVLRNSQTETFDIEFPVYFDENKQPTEIILNKVYILESYSGLDEYWEQEMENAIKKYSITIGL